MTAAARQTGAAAALPGAVHENFHALRLAFALMVVFHHLIALPDVPEWRFLSGFGGLLAETGVQGFFVLSGYLVYGSYARSRTLGLYAEKRVRRLYPAYATVIVVSALAALVASAAARADLGAVARYLGWNLVFLNFGEPHLPGLFEGNRFTEVNGAMWTLKIEVMFYLVLPLLALLLKLAGRFRWALIALIYVGAEVWRFALNQAAEEDVARQLPGQLSFFITGVALFMLQGRVAWRSPVVLGAVAVLVLSYLTPAVEPLRAAGLGIVTLWIATGPSAPFDAARFGDLSYGLYIIHFPVIQAIVAAGLFAASPLAGAGAALGVSLVLALLLWRYVERPFLRPDSAYRRAPNPA